MKIITVKGSELIQDWTGKDYVQAQDLIEEGCWFFFESSAYAMAGTIYFSADNDPSNSNDIPVDLRLEN